MSTPMSVYSRIAKRYGVDPSDEEAVDEFFLKVVPAMGADVRAAILRELLRCIEGRHGPAVSMDGREEEIPLMPLEAAPPITRPSRTAPSIDDRLNAIVRELIGNGITLAQAVEAFEGKYIVAAMTVSRGNVTRASKKLGVHRNSLHNKLRTQTMLNGFAESIMPVRRRLSHKRTSAPSHLSKRKPR